MASVDLRRYIDLTLLDMQAMDVFQNALSLGAAVWPEWEPVEGNTEVVLLQGMAIEASEVIYAVNRTPGAVAGAILRLFGLVPDPGQKAEGIVTITMADSLGHNVPAGTRIKLDLGANLLPVVLVTDIELVVSPGDDTGTVAVTAELIGTRGTGIAVPAPLTLIDAVFYVETAELTTTLSGGSWPEANEDFLSRGVTALGQLTSTLVLPNQFAVETLVNHYIDGRAVALDNYDGSGANAGTDYGHVTVAVLKSDGTLLSSGEKTALAASLDAKAQANLAVHIIDPTVTAVNVTAQITVLAGYDEAAVISDVEDALEAFLNPLTWPWSATVRRNDIIALIENVPGVDFLTAGHPTTPAANVTLSGEAPLADAGTLTITAT